MIVSNFFTYGKWIMIALLTCFLNLSGNVAMAANSPVESANDLQKYIEIAERQNHIPRGLLSAIAKVESGFKPYALNINGKSLVARNSHEAAMLIKQALYRGINNIDVGIMQVNWRWHGKNFNSLEEILDPEANIKYAAGFLSSLYKKHGNWHKAIRYYHSANYSRHRVYSKKIVLAWLDG